MKKKKLVANILIITMLLGLTACSSSTENGTEEAESEDTEDSIQIEEDTVNEEDLTTEDETTEEASTDFENWTKILTSGIVEGEDVEFDMLPDGYNDTPSEHEGTTATIHYTTDVYNNGQTYEKYARVYLPYGYDPDDTEKKYNVIYFQHGNGGSPNELFDTSFQPWGLNTWNLINNIFDPDHQVMEPCIIVCPTYYLEFDETSFKTPADNPAGDGQYKGIEANYYMEVVQDLIPAVESQFNVYCQDFSEEGIVETRDHRAWIGYSRGSSCTWYMFHYDFEYFKYWGPMSCPYEQNINETGEESTYTAEEIYDYLKEAIDEYPNLDFFLFGTAGGEADDVRDIAGPMMEYFKYMAEQTDTFSFGLDPEKDNVYFCRNESEHDDYFMPFSLANFAKVFFK